MKLADHWFFSNTQLPSGEFAFSAEETLHATKALRLKTGDRLQFTDGKGSRYEGRITTMTRGGFTAAVHALRLGGCAETYDLVCRRTPRCC